MSHKHKTMIEKVYEHPTSANIDIKRLFAALEHYGVKVEISKKHKAKLYYGENEFSLILPHNDTISKDEIARMRHFLEASGLTPESVE